jgi:hypothetical protein
MEFRQLGRSGLKVSVLTLGTMTFGGKGAFAKTGSTDIEGARHQIDLRLDAGINLFDTADVYSGGLSEEILGSKPVRRDAQRDQQRNRCRLSVEPHAHHRPVEDQPDDRLIGERTAIPSVPIALCLAPNPADRVLPRGAAEQSRERPAHPPRVGPGKIGAGD